MFSPAAGINAISNDHRKCAAKASIAAVYIQKRSYTQRLQTRKKISVVVAHTWMHSKTNYKLNERWWSHKHSHTHTSTNWGETNKLFTFFLCTLSLSPGPVIGNFSDEEANGNSISQENSIEYPLQRDEVQTANKGERNHVTQSEFRFRECFIFSSISLALSSLLLMLINEESFETELICVIGTTLICLR